MTESRAWEMNAPMPSSKNSRWVHAAGLLLSGIFLYLCFRSLKWEDVERALSAPRPWLLIVAILGNFVVLGFKTLVWKILLDPQAKISFVYLFEVQHVGCMANVLLPLKAGEFLKASLISKKCGISYARVFTSVAVERYLAGFSLVLLAALLAIFFPLPAWIKTGAATLSAILLAIQIGLFFLWKRQPNLKKWENRRPWIHRAFKILSQIGEGSQAIRSGRSFFLLTLLSMLVWLAEVVMLKLVEAAFGLELSWIAPILVLIAINLTIALPSAPGNLGSFEFAAVLAYTSLGVAKPLALGIALSFHLIQILPVTVIGLFFFFLWGFRMQEFKNLKAE
ncbi:MAG: flippase-like domain-containing protein [Deltaproteobacteria bacterium]|nr:flippase-like domain-containing protein [Deltaproteobacteria bacterium]